MAIINQRQDSAWEKDGWQKFPALQQPRYPDLEAYNEVITKLKTYPPLVSSGEIDVLKAQLASASKGKGFLLQAGDCAERFIDCNARVLMNQLKIILQMSVILTYGLRTPIIRLGRIAGQYAKPRSQEMQIVDGAEMPNYRGDSVNGYSQNSANRTPDPQRLLQSYFHSSATLNFIRAMIGGGFADLHNPYNWKLHSIEKTEKWRDYEQIAGNVLDAINFLESLGGARSEALGKVDFFTSHEGLLLGYEEALTRRDSRTGNFYNVGAHFLWIGERTRAVDSAHVEYFRGVKNPIGVKIGPTCDGEELAELLQILNPENEAGRITLITRMGAERIESSLPGLIKKVNALNKRVLWSCDPMHGNIITVAGRRKSRDFSAIVRELQHAGRIHQEAGTRLSGVHLELTGEDVTECIGGAMELTSDDLHKNYATYCDPRLNYSQSLEMAFLLTKLFGKK